jgi:TolB protein
MSPLHVPCAALVLLLAAAIAGSQPAPRPKVRSEINIIAPDGTGKKTIYAADRHIEAPNWSPDGKYLLLNSEGKLWRLPLEDGSEMELLPTGNVKGINNDHGISPDGKLFVISAGHMYTLPSTGGEPRQITEFRPSYYHGWSPDGKTLAYCAPREKNFDIYSIPVEGGPEKRLTVHPGYDDGPDYSPDGRWIYFNSDRSGSWDIWRVPASGGGPDDSLAQQVTSDELEDWFPHPSPDGKWMVLLSYEKGTKGHPANQNVVLRIMPMPGEKLRSPKFREVVKLFGGQGTINVNSWAPDSRRFAYVSYQLLP